MIFFFKRKPFKTKTQPPRPPHLHNCAVIRSFPMRFQLSSIVQRWITGQSRALGLHPYFDGGTHDASALGFMFGIILPSSE
ncbi:hypothetical protein ABKN59_006242 [Abortiporus biennis]